VSRLTEKLQIITKKKKDLTVVFCGYRITKKDIVKKVLTLLAFSSDDENYFLLLINNETHFLWD
jgi:hypothetical protein